MVAEPQEERDDTKKVSPNIFISVYSQLLHKTYIDVLARDLVRPLQNMVDINVWIENV